MTSWSRPLAAALLLGASLVASDAHAQPRILGSSVSIEPKSFGARVVVAGDPEGRVARVVFALAPRCSGDPTSAKYTSVPEVVASVATTDGANRAFSAQLPDPSGGAFGAWTVRSTALDAAGGVVGRHQTVVVRTFEPKFRTLAFQPSAKGAPGAGALDTSAGPATGRLIVDVDHDAAITGLALITSAHDNPVLGYAAPPSSLVADRTAGITPWLTSRLEQTGPTSLVGHFGFPASTPPLALTVARLFMTDARCRTAELAPPAPLTLAVSSSSPRAMPVDVRLDGAALDRGQLVVAFRWIGPSPRTAPAPEVGGAPAPLVTVNLLDGATPPRVLGSTAARPVPGPPAAGKTWDGQSMATAPITLPTGPTALGEALKRGLQVELDDGRKPLGPRAVLRKR